MAVILIYKKTKGNQKNKNIQQGINHDATRRQSLPIQSGFPLHRMGIFLLLTILIIMLEIADIGRVE